MNRNVECVLNREPRVLFCHGEGPIVKKLNRRDIMEDYLFAGEICTNSATDDVREDESDENRK